MVDFDIKANMYVLGFCTVLFGHFSFETNLCYSFEIQKLMFIRYKVVELKSWFYVHWCLSFPILLPFFFVYCYFALREDLREEIKFDLYYLLRFMRDKNY